MTAASYPLRLLPRYVEKPWGGRRIGSLFGRTLPGTAPIGESWELYDRPDGSSVVANGPLAGRPIAGLRGGRPVPLLTKVIDARETLSLQVHPDAEAARELDAEEKSEAWYVLEAAPGARIYRGFREGAGAPALLRAIDEGRVEDCLHSFAPEAGDVVLVPAGTVHAIGAGIVLYEVQRNADTTYRLHDWGRVGLDGQPRPLHRHEAIRCADFTGPGIDRVEPSPIGDDGNCRRTTRVSTAHFVLEEQAVSGLSTFETERNGRARWHSVFILAGEGTFRPFRRGAPEASFAAGDSLLLPAEHPEYELTPRPGTPVRLLATHVP